MEGEPHRDSESLRARQALFLFRAHLPSSALDLTHLWAGLPTSPAAENEKQTEQQSLGKEEPNQRLRRDCHGLGAAVARNMFLASAKAKQDKGNMHLPQAQTTLQRDPQREEARHGGKMIP